MKRKQWNEQKGVTLIELLAAITLSTIVIAIAFSALFSAIKIYKDNQAQARLQQEADIILSHLNQISEKQNEITIRLGPDSRTLTIAANDDTYTYDQNYYEISINSNQLQPGDSVTLKTNTPIPILLYVKDRNLSNQQVKVSTTLERIH
ncbi:prepilin-type N-terminal cleavage/methylation domain-containing protein [Bacillus sp. FSL W8-1127]|uniref:PilW family protein n=1 Tax=Bacillus TaxID=1386 RepID=UPI002E240CD5|nr:prepilin-type N-terminal cleavage/methylation domain-containing protein [Bacillus smithii]MED4882415.1 prepilin-type N-terminal cleavage/methylation domain-containing protein [Bacillus smithii]MED4927569.1 prepilin-type N-terminal cleavage/methylation domain-containing protein [Bacillus smithii]